MHAGWKRLLYGRSLRRTLIRSAFWAAGLYLVLGGLARPMLVRGRSMEPTVRDGRLRFAHMWRYAFRPPERGDIVVITMPGGRTFYCKRIVGLPGERVAFADGALLVNGEARAEPYLRDHGGWTVPPVDLVAGTYYVVGDNRSMPMSEQVAGVVARRHIAGGLW